jgi:hypothetical protein
MRYEILVIQNEDVIVFMVAHDEKDAKKEKKRLQDMFPTHEIKIKEIK